MEENKNVVPVPAENTENVEKKPGFFKRTFGKIKNGLRKVKENPVTCAVCSAIGAAGALGIKAYIDHKRFVPLESGDDFEEIQEETPEETVDEEE